MKTIVLFARHNTGVIALSHLWALGHNVKVVTNDMNVVSVAKLYGCELVGAEYMGTFDMVLSVHWDKIIPTFLFNRKPAVNIHPCLFKYKGKDPIRKHIDNKDTVGSVAAHHMIDKVDEGKLICEYMFDTGVCRSYGEFYNTAFLYYYKTINKVLETVFR